MRPWVEILDHGDDPGRFTLIYGDGRLLTVNQTGKVVYTRQVRNPGNLVQLLTREKGIHILTPKKVPALLKKIKLFLNPNEEL